MLMPSSKEDLFTPVHKSVRSMIYDVGRELQKTDFADHGATDKICSKLEFDFRTASSSCMLCYLSSHARDETRYVFSVMQKYEPDMVQMLLREHEEIERKLGDLTKMSAELKALENLEERILKGDELNRAVNDFFAYYITHMNKEEATILPATQKYLTDQEMMKIRANIVQALPPDRAPVQLSWFVRSNTINELTGVLKGMKATMPPPAFEGVMKITEQNVSKDDWEQIRARL